ncbi:hypothetical protein [Halosolutus halophilus]|uniref:hypothetical protein n=1 Tax=Halosolutus halophilus TaxID=1552990 RepID=UPI0022352126|nr:hypothetical protein [Halosolutus halophilus]
MAVERELAADAKNPLLVDDPSEFVSGLDVRSSSDGGQDGDGVAVIPVGSFSTRWDMRDGISITELAS